MRTAIPRPRLLPTLLAATCALFTPGSSFAQTAEGADSATSANDKGAESTDLQPSSFQELTPGESKLTDVKEKLGEPVESLTLDGLPVLIYKVGPFPRVEISLEKEIVVSIVIHLDKPLQPKEVAKQLSLADFRSVPVLDDDGEPLGEAYPERGVLLSYAPGKREVAQLILEPISTDAIRLRINNREPADISGKLTDISLLLAQEGESPELHWQRARLSLQAGDFQQAAEASKQSLAASPQDPRFVLTAAELLLANGESTKAAELLDKLLAESPAALVQAQAQHLLGNAKASGEKPDFKEAILLQTSAIKLATPFASSKTPADRKAASTILVEASLGVANSIARGSWARKKEVVPKWLRSSEVLAMKAIKDGDAGQGLRLHVWRRTLEVYQSMGAYDEAMDVFEAAQQGGKQLLKNEDPFYRAFVQREMIRSTFAVVRLEQSRDEHASALKHANEAIKLIDGLDAGDEMNGLDAYLVGRLYYYVGAIYSVQHRDHKEAVRWYERAQAHLSLQLPESEMHDLGVHGERFVSMGVSYWETGVRAEGVKLTKSGMDNMKRAVEIKLISEQSLAVPYNNLAAMLRKQGRDDEAREYARQAARLPASDGNTKR